MTLIERERTRAAAKGKGQAGRCATSPCSLPANRGELRTVCQILDRPAPKQLYGHLCQASPSLSYGRLDPFFCPEPSYTDTHTTRPDPMLATGVINRRCQKTVPLVGEISVTEKWDCLMFGGVRRGRTSEGRPSTSSALLASLGPHFLETSSLRDSFNQPSTALAA